MGGVETQKSIPVLLFPVSVTHSQIDHSPVLVLFH